VQTSKSAGINRYLALVMMAHFRTTFQKTDEAAAGQTMVAHLQKHDQ